MATKRKSRILEEMHKTARDLHRLGFIDRRRMSEFDALCKLEVPVLSARRIKALRENLHVSQPVFAARSTPARPPCRNGRLARRNPAALR